MRSAKPLLTRNRLDPRILASIDEHIADAAAARAGALAKHANCAALHRPDPSRRLMFQLADAYVRELAASRARLDGR